MKKVLLSAAMLVLPLLAMAQDFKWQPFYTQTYENVAQVGDVWNCPYNQGGLSLKKDENGNQYVYYIGSGSGDRGMRNLDVLTADDYEGLTEYRLEFDLALGSNSQDNHRTEFHVASPDLSYNSNNINFGIGDGSLFSLFQIGGNSNVWRLYSQAAVGNNAWLGDANYTITLDSEVFYRFAITVSGSTEEDGWDANVTVEVSDMNGNPVNIHNEDTKEDVMSVTLPYTDLGGGYWFNNFYPRPSRNGGVFMIDNIKVMKKVDASTVTPPILSLTAVNGENRVITIDNSLIEEAVTSYYAIVDENTYESAETAEGLSGVVYAEPFVVNNTTNYILAWNQNENGTASELTRYTCEAGYAVQLNKPVITLSEISGENKTYVVTCDQNNVMPVAPLSYNIYMSADGVNWTETNTLTVTGGTVYAKASAEGYADAENTVLVPSGVYVENTWSVVGTTINESDCPDFFFDNSGKGRVHVPVRYWAEDNDAYDENGAWAPLRENGMHFNVNGGDSDMFVLGSGNRGSFTVTGLTVYGTNKATVTIGNVAKDDFVCVAYSDETFVSYVIDSLEPLTLPIPQYGTSAALASIKHYTLDLTTAVNDVKVQDAVVNVVTVDGVVLRRGVKASEALRGLKSGLYIVNGAKVAK